MKYLFALLLLANATQGVAQGDSIQSGSMKVEDVQLKSSYVQLQPGESAQDLANRFPSSVPNEERVYIINGVPLNFEALKVLNPNDIVSVIVLKDASETLIGCNRSPYNVIVIKTKKNLTKRELRKQNREERRAAKKLAKE
ncbi:hypothetical protein OGH69_09060 [Flavobacterium sp. MFBS3-15]|uniref:hypothetical protein n=1 Tax=Flavobacterium sp. MFBS3-15 TaxID=2989816 RepID=UPI00223686E7|nr:hypothetical protein [Flavobacterium sp. MFBS3-15]MCW4469111.1 hypothetical protein [Flavobacterium sp. MFBS3-15]